MTFEHYWFILMRHWRFVLCCSLLSGISALIIGLCLVPVYQSTVLVQVVVHSSSDQSDINNLLASNQLVQTEASLATSDSVLRAVASHYPALTSGQLAHMVSINVHLNTQLFDINVQDTDSARAALLANDVAATLVNQQQEAVQHEDTATQQQLQKNIDHLNQQITDLKHRLTLAQGAANSGTAASLQDQITDLQQQVNQWQQALVQLNLMEAQRGNLLRIDQTARPSAVSIRPDVPLYTVIGLFGGFLSGCLVLLFVQSVDAPIYTPADLHFSVAWPVLATLYDEGVARSGSSAISSRGSLNAEAYRQLRMSLSSPKSEQPLRSIMVVSLYAGGGTSTVAANLACSLARVGKKTLLVDANLHRPVQHRFFRLSPESYGLSNALFLYSSLLSASAFSPSQTGRLASSVSSPTTPDTSKMSLVPPLRDFIHDVGMVALGVMPSGPLPPDSSVLFDSCTFPNFLRLLTDFSGDIVVVDAPPLLETADSCSLASSVDGLILVLDMRYARRSMLKQAQELLQRCDTNVIGCVFNQRSDSRWHLHPISSLLRSLHDVSSLFSSSQSSL